MAIADEDQNSGQFGGHGEENVNKSLEDVELRVRTDGRRRIRS